MLFEFQNQTNLAVTHRRELNWVVHPIGKTAQYGTIVITRGGKMHFERVHVTRSIFAAAVATILASAPAMAIDAAAPVASPFFGYFEGGYVFQSPVQQWQLFGPDYVNTGLTGPGAGWRGKASIGYHPGGTWEIVAALEGGSESDGPISTGSFLNGQLHDDHWIVDGLAAYELSPDWKLGAGVRWANWNNHIDTSNTARINHSFYGIGPRIELDGSMPFGDSVTLESDLGASVLFGNIYTTSSDAWDCTSCNTENVTAFDLDASLGVGFHLGATTKAVVGIQGQYWSGINVAVTDDDGAGLNQRTSAAFLAGPFVRLQF